MRYSFVEKFFFLHLISYLFLLALIGILSDEKINRLDFAYNIIFTIEITLKIIGFGIRSKFLEKI